MGWTGPLQPISKREARHRYRQGLLIGVGNETHHGAHTGYAFTAQDVDGVTFDELVERSTDGRRPYAVYWWRPAYKPRRAEPRRAAVAEDQAAAGNTGVTPPPPAIATRLRAAADLAEGIANLTAAWDAAKDIDSTLGSEVERVGLWSIDVLHATAADIRETEPLRAAVLTRYAEELNNAVDAYADLPEHEVDHSLDIFDRLAPGSSSCGMFSPSSGTRRPASAPRSAR